MTAESNPSFHQGNSYSSGLQRHAISFQSGPLQSTSDIIPNGNYYGVNSRNGNLMFCDNTSIISNGSPTVSGAGNSSGSLLLDSVPGLKHDAGLAVEWTEEEQLLLEQGLVKYKDEPKIMRYIKIAAILPDKTVRDVALRWRWMARKRIKQEDSNWGRKGSYRKDKFAESSSKTNLPSTSMPNVAPYSFQRHQMDQNQRLKCQVLSSKANQLLEQNIQAFNQIDDNIVQACNQMACLKDIGGAFFNMGSCSSVKSECSQLVQDNIELFCRARDNINDINVALNNMQELSSKMSHMRDFPVSIDQNLVNMILPRTTL